MSACPDSGDKSSVAEWRAQPVTSANAAERKDRLTDLGDPCL